MSTKVADRTQDNREAVDRIRKILADGLSFVRGAEVTEAVSSRSFEETLVMAINDLEQDESDIRPSRISAVRELKEAIVDAVARAKELPASVFALSDESATNTREDGTGSTEMD
jgi:hypothetical protein